MRIETWVERDGALAGATAGKNAVAVAALAFTSGCSACSLDTRLMTAGGVFSKVWVLGWYQDKRNLVELLVNEEGNKLILKQRAGGQVVAKAKASVGLGPNRFYTFEISFDGNEFRVRMDGAPVIQMPKAPGTSPVGTVGFQVKNTTAIFDFISVSH